MGNLQNKKIMLTCRAISTGGLGRFGNTCFTLAGTIGISIKSGQPYGFDRWRTVDNAIFGEPIDDIEEHLLNELPRIPDGVQFNDYAHYFWGYQDVFLPTGNWNIHAHMQSYKFFSHCIDRIREVFRFKDEFSPVDAVALHIRCGDYIDDENAQHPICSKEYYEKAVALFPNDRICVFSDDMEKAMQILPQDNSKFYFPRTDKGYIKDFKFMKAHKHFITANSSFSFFAALLGEHPDKKIIMPSRWFGSQMPPEFDTKDIYPEEAIVI